MTAAPGILLPGGRVLLGWWRELSHLQPQRLWFASLLLSRMEALVERTRVHPLDPLHHGFLCALGRPSEDGLPTLHLDARVQAGLVHDLVRLGLVEEGEGRQLTAEGQAAQARGALIQQGRERAVFHFLAGTPARYLPLLRDSTTPIPLPEGWKFDPAVLETCLRQPDTWKASHYFPTDIDRLVKPPDDRPPEWEQVILVSPEQLLLALVQVPADAQGNVLLGFAVHPDGWRMDASSPVLALPEGCREVLPGLANDPPPGDWKKAWQSWCQPRSLPAAEVDACQLESEGSRLVVRAPAKLVERLRASRSDALKGEAWLLAGTGRSRAAALIELHELATGGT